jgi:uncharacterized protein YecE (DUF72 family)
MKNYRIGCSGYYYQSWKDKFYPPGTPTKDWLKYYSHIFNTVELNAPFYRQPKAKNLKQYARVTGDDFDFTVKMSRYISHIKKLKDCKKEIADFQDLILNGLGEKLALFLFQMPPNFHFNEENLNRVLESVPHDPRNVIEFRHQSWWNEETEKELKKAKITFCNVDFPGIDSYFINTSPVFYLRLHGSPHLFVSPYSKTQLEKYYSEFPARKKGYYVYFNNTDRGAAHVNAQELMEICGMKIQREQAVMDFQQ